MNGHCDFCDEPDHFTCDATGCNHVMCGDHTYPRLAATLDPEHHPSAKFTYCPEHRDLGNVEKP